VSRAHRSKLRAAWPALVVVLLAMLGGTALAQAPERQRAFVYGINAAFARTYVGSFAPPSTTTIYLLADQTSIISPRATQIYFWPITNEYKASWELLNEPVPGTLEVLQGGRVIRQILPTSYTIHYQAQAGSGSPVAQLYTGTEAEAAHEWFTADQQRYQAELRAYYSDQRAWMVEADDANRRIRNGENVTLRPAPVAPAPISVTSNGINQGVPINLPAGNYQIQLRAADGTIVPDSARDLVVFGPRRATIGYVVVPQTRWTTPDQIDDPSAVIIGKADSQLYLVPHEMQEYPARAYALLQNPQRQFGETTDWSWALGAPIASGELEVVAADGASERQALTPYRVQQTPGNSLGYDILPFIPDPERPHAAPDLVGFPLPIGGAGSSFEVRLVTDQGQVLPGSARQVRASSTVPLLGLALLAAVPLAVGAVVITRRRARLRLPRNIAG
jgi:hypothetical protein